MGLLDAQLFYFASHLSAHGSHHPPTRLLSPYIYVSVCLSVAIDERSVLLLFLLLLSPCNDELYD